jgi:hypothetical protein
MILGVYVRVFERRLACVSEWTKWGRYALHVGEYQPISWDTETRERQLGVSLSRR